jgi:hypothetical protein
MPSNKPSKKTAKKIPRARKQRAEEVLAETAAPLAQSRIREKHWDMPASFTFDGSRMASLREHIDPAVPTKNLIELSEDQLVDLTIRRLEMEPDDFKLAMMGVGIVDKHRAVAEVKARSWIGRSLVEIEQILIAHLEKTGKSQK